MNQVRICFDVLFCYLHNWETSAVERKMNQPIWNLAIRDNLTRFLPLHLSEVGLDEGMASSPTTRRQSDKPAHLRLEVTTRLANETSDLFFFPLYAPFLQNKDQEPRVGRGVREPCPGAL